MSRSEPVSHVIEAFEDLPSAEMGENFLQDEKCLLHLSKMCSPVLDIRFA